MSVIQCGVSDDDGINAALKCHISGNVDGTDIGIYAYIIEGSSLSLESRFNNPFEGDHVGGNVLGKAGALAQEAMDVTLKSKANSIAVWDGIGQAQFSLVLYFHAYVDAKKEVNDPIKYLLMMMSPELSEVLPIGLNTAEEMTTGNVSGLKGRSPRQYVFDIGRSIKVPAVITNVSYDLSAPKTTDGYFAYNTVQLTIQPKNIFNRSEISSVFS